jgi:hypothetical protein
VALNNALAHERFQTLAAVDPLTGAFNRRSGLQRPNEECSRSNRAEGPLGVLAFDIDHFKAVNDDHGHLVGDRVLQRPGWLGPPVQGHPRSGVITQVTANPGRSRLGVSLTRPPIWNRITCACSSPATNSAASRSRKGRCPTMTSDSSVDSASQARPA